MTEPQTTWLSQESFDRLSAELHDLETRGREEVAERIEAARSEGDLRENGGYQAAREEQSKMEGRIVELTLLLRNAEVGEGDVDTSKVGPGVVVTAEINGQEQKFLLGSRQAAADLSINVYPEAAPLGAAIMGATVGDERSYKAPNGKDITIKILELEALR
ncbi:transcription elongation factor GreA [Flaviflexus equikiangi]|uniref:Transcription elongation factor GreA n=1 Tax=Flaviflexus equikiangi TaxID=2758573 RepID=A0ABS2TD79_9ACTO|nr:transcription elongation factor GreA [Flaviflexus equikiangi]MBM9432609.1 transcription elongation factor GreA [Flaviflexus equikiangi]